MYKNVLLTDKEISLLKRVIGDTLHEKLLPEARNLTIILNRLRGIKPTKVYNQSIDQGYRPTNEKQIKWKINILNYWANLKAMR